MFLSLASNQPLVFEGEMYHLQKKILMGNEVITQQQKSAFYRDGYIVLKQFFSNAEIDKMYSTALADDVMRKNALDLNDQTGKKTRLSLWFTPGQ